MTDIPIFTGEIIGKDFRHRSPSEYDDHFWPIFNCIKCRDNFFLQNIIRVKSMRFWYCETPEKGQPSIILDFLDGVTICDKKYFFLFIQLEELLIGANLPEEKCVSILRIRDKFRLKKCPRNDPSTQMWSLLFILTQEFSSQTNDDIRPSIGEYCLHLLWEPTWAMLILVDKDHRNPERHHRLTISPTDKSLIHGKSTPIYIQWLRLDPEKVPSIDTNEEEKVWWKLDKCNETEKIFFHRLKIKKYFFLFRFKSEQFSCLVSWKQEVSKIIICRKVLDLEFTPILQNTDQLIERCFDRVGDIEYIRCIIGKAQIYCLNCIWNMKKIPWLFTVAIEDNLAFFMDRIEKRYYDSSRIFPVDIGKSENDRSKSIISRIVGKDFFCE